MRQKRYYRDFLSSSEGIATNILAARLRSMLDEGLITKMNDPENKSQVIYTPTQKTTAILPVLKAMVKWGLKYGSNTKDPFSKLHKDGDNSK